MLIPKWILLNIIFIICTSASASDDLMTQLLRQVTQEQAESISRAQYIARSYLLQTLTMVRNRITHFNGYNTIVDNIVRGLQSRELEPLKIVKDRSFFSNTPTLRQLAIVIYSMQGCNEATDYSISRWEAVLNAIPEMSHYLTPIQGLNIGEIEYDIIDKLDRPFVNFVLTSVYYNYLRVNNNLLQGILQNYAFVPYSPDIAPIIRNVNERLTFSPFENLQLEAPTGRMASEDLSSSTLKRILSSIVTRLELEPQFVYQIKLILNLLDSDLLGRSSSENDAVAEWLSAMRVGDYPEDILQARDELTEMIRNGSLLTKVDLNTLKEDMVGHPPTARVLGLLSRLLVLSPLDPTAVRVHALYSFAKLQQIARSESYFIPRSTADIAFLLNAFLTVKNQVNFGLVQQINEIFVSDFDWNALYRDFDFSKYSDPRRLLLSMLKHIGEKYKLPACHVIAIEYFLQQNTERTCTGNEDDLLKNQLTGSTTPIVPVFNGIRENTTALVSAVAPKNCTNGPPVRVVDPNCLIEIIDTTQHAGFITDLIKYNPIPAEKYPYETRYAVFTSVLDDLKTDKYTDDISEFVISQAMLRLPLNDKANLPPTYKLLCPEEIQVLEMNAPTTQPAATTTPSPVTPLRTVVTPECNNMTQVVDRDSLWEAVNKTYDWSRLRQVLYAEPVFYQEYASLNTKAAILGAVLETRIKRLDSRDMDAVLASFVQLCPFTQNGELPPDVLFLCNEKPSYVIPAGMVGYGVGNVGVIGVQEFSVTESIPTFTTSSPYTNTIQNTVDTRFTQKYTEVTTQLCNPNEELTLIIDTDALLTILPAEAPKAQFLRNRIRSYVIPVTPEMNYTSAEMLRYILSAIRDEMNDPRVTSNVETLLGYIPETPVTYPATSYACLPTSASITQLSYQPRFKMKECAQIACSPDETIAAVIDTDCLFEALRPGAPKNPEIADRVRAYVMPIDPSKNYKKGDVLRDVLRDLLKNVNDTAVQQDVSNALNDIGSGGAADERPRTVNVCFPKAYLGGVAGAQPATADGLCVLPEVLPLSSRSPPPFAVTTPMPLFTYAPPTVNPPVVPMMNHPVQTQNVYFQPQPSPSLVVNPEQQPVEVLPVMTPVGGPQPPSNSSPVLFQYISISTPQQPPAVPFQPPTPSVPMPVAAQSQVNPVPPAFQQPSVMSVAAASITPGPVAVMMTSDTQSMAVYSPAVYPQPYPQFNIPSVNPTSMPVQYVAMSPAVPVDSVANPVQIADMSPPPSPVAVESGANVSPTSMPVQALVASSPPVAEDPAVNPILYVSETPSPVQGSVISPVQAPIQPEGPAPPELSASSSAAAAAAADDSPENLISPEESSNGTVLPTGVPQNMIVSVPSLLVQFVSMQPNLTLVTISPTSDPPVAETGTTPPPEALPQDQTFGVGSVSSPPPQMQNCQPNPSPVAPPLQMGGFGSISRPLSPPQEPQPVQLSDNLRQTAPPPSAVAVAADAQQSPSFQQAVVPYQPQAVSYLPGVPTSPSAWPYQYIAVSPSSSPVQYVPAEVSSAGPDSTFYTQQPYPYVSFAHPPQSVLIPSQPVPVAVSPDNQTPQQVLSGGPQMTFEVPQPSPIPAVINQPIGPQNPMVVPYPQQPIIPASPPQFQPPPSAAVPVNTVNPPMQEISVSPPNQPLQPVISQSPILVPAPTPEPAGSAVAVAVDSASNVGSSQTEGNAQLQQSGSAVAVAADSSTSPVQIQDTVPQQSSSGVMPVQSPSQVSLPLQPLQPIVFHPSGETTPPPAAVAANPIPTVIQTQPPAVTVDNTNPTGISNIPVSLPNQPLQPVVPQVPVQVPTSEGAGSAVAVAVDSASNASPYQSSIPEGLAPQSPAPSAVDSVTGANSVAVQQQQVILQESPPAPYLPPELVSPNPAGISSPDINVAVMPQSDGQEVPTSSSGSAVAVAASADSASNYQPPQQTPLESSLSVQSPSAEGAVVADSSIQGSTAPGQVLVSDGSGQLSAAASAAAAASSSDGSVQLQPQQLVNFQPPGQESPPAPHLPSELTNPIPAGIFSPDYVNSAAVPQPSESQSSANVQSVPETFNKWSEPSTESPFMTTSVTAPTDLYQTPSPNILVPQNVDSGYLPEQTTLGSIVMGTTRTVGTVGEILTMPSGSLQGNVQQQEGMMMMQCNNPGEILTQLISTPHLLQLLPSSPQAPQVRDAINKTRILASNFINQTNADIVKHILREIIANSKEVGVATMAKLLIDNVNTEELLQEPKFVYECLTKTNLDSCPFFRGTPTLRFPVNCTQSKSFIDPEALLTVLPPEEIERARPIALVLGSIDLPWESYGQFQKKSQLLIHILSEIEREIRNEMMKSPVDALNTLLNEVLYLKASVVVDGPTDTRPEPVIRCPLRNNCGSTRGGELPPKRKIKKTRIIYNSNESIKVLVQTKNGSDEEVVNGYTQEPGATPETGNLIRETTEIYYNPTTAPEIANIVLNPDSSIAYMHPPENASLPGYYELLKWPILLKPEGNKSCYDNRNQVYTSPVLVINITSLLEVINPTAASELDEYLTASYLTSLDTYYKLSDFDFGNYTTKEEFLRGILQFLLKSEERHDITEPMKRVLGLIPEVNSTPLQLGALCNYRIYQELPRRTPPGNFTFRYVSSKVCPTGVVSYEMTVVTDALPPKTTMEQLETFRERASQNRIFENVEWEKLQNQVEFGQVLLNVIQDFGELSGYIRKEMECNLWKTSPVAVRTTCYPTNV